MKYKEGDVVTFTTKFSKDNVTGVIDKIPNKNTQTKIDYCYVVDIDDDYEYKIQFQDIVELVSKGEYELGEYVCLDFIDSKFACMICGKEETWEGYFYTVEIQNEKGNAIFFIDGLTTKLDEVDYKLTWDIKRNENS